MNIGEITQNKLMVSIDWLSFTVKEEWTPDDVLRYLGMNVSEFEVMPKGASGYKAMLRHERESVTVLYDGGEGMGIHVNITGSAISYALDMFRFSREASLECPADNLMCHYLSHVKKIADITRIDTAIDDIGARFFTVTDILGLVQSGHMVSKFRSYEHIIKASISTGVAEGNTLYIGSKKSDFFVRVYDKGLEQKVSVPWVRWELQIRNAQGNAYADELIKSGRISPVAVGVLAHYVRFIEHDDINRSRCSMYPAWVSFLDGVMPLCLSIPKKDPSVEKKLDWIKKQCMPTISGLVMSYGDDVSKQLGGLQYHYDRLSLPLRDMFESFATHRLEEMSSDKN